MSVDGEKIFSLPPKIKIDKKKSNYIKIIVCHTVCKCFLSIGGVVAEHRVAPI